MESNEMKARSKSTQNISSRLKTDNLAAAAQGKRV